MSHRRQPGRLEIPPDSRDSRQGATGAFPATEIGAGETRWMLGRLNTAASVPPASKSAMTGWARFTSTRSTTPRLASTRQPTARTMLGIRSREQLAAATETARTNS